MSATRRREHAAKTTEATAEKAAAKVAAKGRPQTRASVPKTPSARPYQEPEQVLKKRVVRNVSERDGRNLLRRIEAKGGVDIIVMMRDSERTPQEVAESLMMDEAIVITCLDAYGGGKDRMKRLIVAIEQASSYLEDTGRPVTTGVKREQRVTAAREKRAALEAHKRNPRVRVHVVPTLDEVAPRLEDWQIVLEELKRYLEQNVGLRDQVVNASSDSKAAGILLLNAGRGFDARVKALLVAPDGYQELLAEAGATIRGEVRKYDTSDVVPTSLEQSAEESPEAVARFHSLLDAWEARVHTVPSDAGEPEVEEQQERFLHQEEVLRRYQETVDQPS